MSKTRSEVLQESTRKGVAAGVATTATVAAAAIVSLPLAAVVGAPISAYSDGSGGSTAPKTASASERAHRRAIARQIVGRGSSRYFE